MKDNKILIDASHPEETRVVVLEDNEIKEYEFEISSKKELKGNIYYAQVTKVEASLQAAFVEYGEKKQGFLPFSEISVDYFNLPTEVIEEIKIKQKEHKEALRKKALEKRKNNYNQNNLSVHSTNEYNSENNNEDFETSSTEEDLEEIDVLLTEEDLMLHIEDESSAYGTRFGYKIQDVIKPGQTFIIQVSKEERGNKGASMTTYLSLPGRYCVLMPSSSFEGGISKKISNKVDRQRLKNIISNLDIPDNINIVLRTASLDKTEEQITQDYNYVLNLWRFIQKKAKEIKKPGLLFEEGVIIKKVIRDLYSPNTTDIIIEGRKAYETAKGFAKIIAPDIMNVISKFNHPKLSLFKYYNVDDDVKNLYSPVVFLKSGGYFVINIAEALIAIDINSGKSKGRQNVEETAIKTNLEAAEEIAKQIKLRDIGGIIVIDFIDMENRKNKLLLEKKMKEFIKNDKAKIQIGRISNFGLLEISRQRIKSSIIERTLHICNKCQGMGHIKPLELNALSIVRQLKSDAENRRIPTNNDGIVITLPTAEAFYILNNKRHDLNQLENTLKTNIRIQCDDEIGAPFYRIEKDNSDKNESVKTILFSEQEIEANVNRIKHQHNNKNNTHFKKVIENKKNNKKVGFFRKILGL